MIFGIADPLAKLLLGKTAGIAGPGNPFANFSFVHFHIMSPLLCQLFLLAG